MESKKTLYKGLSTYIKGPHDMENYLVILGATIKHGEHGVEFTWQNLEGFIDEDIHGIVFKKDNDDIKELFARYGIRYNPVEDLEGLVLIYTILNDQDIEKNFDNNLYQTKIKMLNSIIERIEQLEFTGLLSEFDSAVAPFVRSDFDPELFADRCNFKTSGFFKKDGFDGYLNFTWSMKDAYGIHYRFELSPTGYESRIDTDDDQFLKHRVSDNNPNETIIYSSDRNNEIQLDIASNTIETITDGIQFPKRQAKETDILPLVEIATTFAQKALAFIKEPKREIYSFTIEKIGDTTGDTRNSGKTRGSRGRNWNRSKRQGKRRRISEKMVTKEYAMAYKEVIEILKYVPDEDVKKIPEEKLEFYKNNMDNEYNYKLDMTKEFEEQDMSEITKAVLANIFRDYWATPNQKEKIEAKEKYDLEKLEEEKREKYNPDNIFKNKKQETVVENTNLPVEIKKETFFKKLISFIKGLFNKNNK